jgi:NifU-like protein
LQDLLDQVWEGQAAVKAGLVQIQPTPVETSPASEFSPYQFAKKVEKVLEEYVRPALRMDGGDVEIVDIKGTVVYCSLRGACRGCAGASQTLKMMVERALKDQVDERIRIVEV